MIVGKIFIVSFTMMRLYFYQVDSTSSFVKGIAVKTSDCWRCGMNFGKLSLTLCRNNTNGKELKNFGCIPKCWVTSPHRAGRETDTSYSHIRSRRGYRDRDANGGCSFPGEERQGYRFDEYELCDDPEINASMQDCCMVTNLDLPLHNDFKTGGEDRYYGKFIDRCRDYELGDISKVYLDGFLIAKHGGFDGVKLDWIKIWTLDERQLDERHMNVYKYGNLVTCYFPEWMDDDSSFLGENCQVEHMEDQGWFP